MGNRYSQRARNEDPGKDKNDEEGGEVREVREERQRGQDEEVDRPTEQIGKIGSPSLYFTRQYSRKHPCFNCENISRKCSGIEKSYSK